jgi:hypothetical protein
MRNALLLGMLVLGACAAPLAASAPSATRTSTAAPVVQPTASLRPSLWPAGGPVPAELEGRWYQSATDAHSAHTLVLSGNTYGLPEVGASGNVVVSGSEILFFSGTGCGAYLPEGIGRYTWSLKGSELWIERIDDPCGRSSLNDAWSRTRP